MTKTYHQRIFNVYMYYRLAMAALLLNLFTTGVGKGLLGTNDPELFSMLIYSNTGICAISLALYSFGLISASVRHTSLLLVIDLTFLVQMMYTQYHSMSTLGYLLLIPIAVGGTFLGGRASMGFAAFTSLLMMLNSALLYWQGVNIEHSLATIGVVGSALFATTAIFYHLAGKVRISEDHLQQQREAHRHLQHIHQHVIETIETGIIVIDSQLTPLFINQSAKTLLFPNKAQYALQNIPALWSSLQQWQQRQRLPEELTIENNTTRKARVRFTQFPDIKEKALLLFIDDEQRLVQQAQQLKLASLGKLSANIAHEIRNPLACIHNASQLLHESPTLAATESELLTIIEGNSQRIDRIIATVLEFSRKKKACKQTIELYPWSQHWLTHYYPVAKSRLTLEQQHTKVCAQIDPDHLQHILTNLLDNAFTHGKAPVRLSIGLEHHSKQPYIDVTDEGDGIDKSVLNHIFEPFYTTGHHSTGLGLYLCKQLCEANHASIHYLQKTTQQNSGFRLLMYPG